MLKVNEGGREGGCFSRGRASKRVDASTEKRLFFIYFFSREREREDVFVVEEISSTPWM